MAGNAGGDEGRFGERRGWYFSGQRRPLMERQLCIDVYGERRENKKGEKSAAVEHCISPERNSNFSLERVSERERGGVGLAALMKKRSKIKFGVCGCFPCIPREWWCGGDEGITKGRRRKENR
ncbi:hypothetical protein HAX54_027893, partial [Datura stramonium]|nr:hypothetical protein [Datura stramonium]